MPSAAAEGGNQFLEKVYSAKSPSELKAVYDAWAQEYDQDIVGSLGYTAPKKAADALAAVLPATPGLKILDAGCGTGLVGVELARNGFKNVDGIDLSEGMLAQAAKTGAYASLNTGDLSSQLPLPENSYDGIICVGTLTEGHVGPEAIAEFARLTKSGGFVAATVLGTIWEPRYRSFVDGLVDAGKIKVVSTDETEYRPNFPIKLRVIVLQVL